MSDLKNNTKKGRYKLTTEIDQNQLIHEWSLFDEDCIAIKDCDT